MTTDGDTPPVMLRLLCLCTLVRALTFRGSFKAYPSGGCLAAARLRLSDGSSFLATAGHGGGGITLYRTPFHSDNLPAPGSEAAIWPDMHGRGPIFALDAWEDLLCAGGFDRRATLTRVDDAAGTPRPVATLPEHTGWVRAVGIVGGGSGGDDDNPAPKPVFATSVGCNLVNVWTRAAASTEGETGAAAAAAAAAEAAAAAAAAGAVAVGGSKKSA